MPSTHAARMTELMSVHFSTIPLAPVAFPRFVSIERFCAQSVRWKFGWGRHPASSFASNRRGCRNLRVSHSASYGALAAAAALPHQPVNQTATRSPGTGTRSTTLANQMHPRLARSFPRSARTVAGVSNGAAAWLTTPPYSSTLLATVSASLAALQAPTST